MKKKYVSTLIIVSALAAIGAVILTGCGEYNVQNIEYGNNMTICDTAPSNVKLIQLEDEGVLYLDNELWSGGKTSSLYHIYTPYYSPNGKLCTLNDGEIVEVNDDSNKDIKPSNFIKQDNNTEEENMKDGW